MKSVERSGVEGAAKYRCGFLAHVFCQVDSLRGGAKIHPAGFPKLEPGFRADQNFVDDDVELGKVIDSLPVIFDLNVDQASLALCRRAVHCECEREKQTSNGKCNPPRVYFCEPSQWMSFKTS